MNNAILAKAEALAKRGYIVEIYEDKTTDGNDIYLAKCPELPGCMAQGNTIEEAMNNVIKSRIDFIYFLLEDSLAVPEPSNKQNEAGEDSFSNITVDTFSESSKFKTITSIPKNVISIKSSENEYKELLFSTSYEV